MKAMAVGLWMIFFLLLDGWIIVVIVEVLNNIKDNI
jgi:hypothetical protein